VRRLFRTTITQLQTTHITALSFFPTKSGKVVLGALILSYSEKKMQHLCKLFLTMEYCVCVYRNIGEACLPPKKCGLYRYEKRYCS